MELFTLRTDVTLKISALDEMYNISEVLGLYIIILNFKNSIKCRILLPNIIVFVNSEIVLTM